MDAAFLVTREEDSDQITIKQSKHRNKKHEPSTFMWTFDSDENDPEKLYSGRFFSLSETDKKQAKAEKRDAQTEALKSDVLNLIRTSEPMTSTEVAEALGRNLAAVTAAIKALEAERKVGFNKDGKAKKYCAL